MISQYDIIKAFRKYEEKGKDLSLKLSEDEKNLIDSETGEVVTTVEAFTIEMRRKEHCDFETIYSEHATLTEIYRCRQCGTVIFGGDDEYHYNPNEKCPTCCNDPSVTWNDYWTKEEIDGDPEKKQAIQAYIDMQSWRNRCEERRTARNGLYDWQRWKKVVKTKKSGYSFELINWEFDGDLGKVPKGKKANKYLEIHKWNINDGIWNHTCQIPLNLYTTWLFYFHPYLKSTHPSVRKYAFWQKTPEKGQLLAMGEYIYTNLHLPEVVKDPVKMKITSIKPDGYHVHYEAKAVNWDHTLCFAKEDIWKTIFRTKKLAITYGK